MTRSSPVTTEPTLKRVQMLLCTACLDGVGEECHTPGCAMYLHRVDLPFPKDTYTEVVDDRAIASFLSFLSKDIASHPDKLRAFPATLAQRIADLTESVEFDPDAAARTPHTYIEVCKNPKCPRGGTPVEIVGSAAEAMRDRNLSLDAAQPSPDEMAAAALARIAKANFSDPETDDLTIPLAIELSETQRRLYYMEEKYGVIDWDAALSSTERDNG